MKNEFDGLNLDSGSRSERLKDGGAVVVGKDIGKDKRHFSNKVSLPSFPFSSFFVFVLMLLICFAFIRSFMGLEPLYFSSFLDILSKSPSVSFSLQIPTTFLGDWGFLNFLRDLIQVSIQILNFLIFIVNGLVNALIYLFYFIENFFGIV